MRPGSAAAASAYQCAAGDMPLATVKFYKSTAALCSEPTTGVGCHAFEIRDFWDPGIRSDGGNCSFWYNKFVVRTSTNPEVYWVVTNPNDFGDGVRDSEPLALATQATADSAVLQPDDSMAFYGREGASSTPFSCGTASKRQGLFLAIGGPFPDAQAPTGWASYGVWPEYADSTSNVLGGSCLTSFPGSSGFTLADG